MLVLVLLWFFGVVLSQPLASVGVSAVIVTPNSVNVTPGILQVHNKKKKKAMLLTLFLSSSKTAMGM